MLACHPQFAGFCLSQCEELMNQVIQLVNLFDLAGQSTLAIIERLAVQ